MQHVMHKGMGTAMALWAAAIVSAVIVIRQVEHPMRGTRAANVTVRNDEKIAQQTAPTAETIAEDEESDAVVVMPMATVVAVRRGAAQMQGANDVVIGPGTVTHPGPVPVAAPSSR